MADLLTVEDLEKAKKHDTFHSEVITGKEGGLSGGADIDYATNAVTGQVQKTLPKTIDDLDWTPVGTFAAGVTFTKSTDYALDASGNQWIYAGASPFPVVVAPGTVPSSQDYKIIYSYDYGELPDGRVIQHRRGTSAEIDAYVLADGEIVKNDDDGSLHVGEGVTAGGIKHINENTLSKYSPLVFAGVADMKSSTKIQENSVVKTSFYSKKPYGAASYLVLSVANYQLFTGLSAPDNIRDHSLQGGLVAMLMPKNGVVTVQQCSAIPYDDSQAVADTNRDAFRAAHLSLKSEWDARKAASTPLTWSTRVESGDYNLSNGYTVPKGMVSFCDSLGAARVKQLPSTVDADPALPTVSLGRVINGTSTETSSGIYVTNPPPKIHNLYINPQDVRSGLDITGIPGFEIGDLWMQAANCIVFGDDTGDGIVGRLFLETGSNGGMLFDDCQNIVIDEVYTFDIQNPIIVRGNPNNIDIGIAQCNYSQVAALQTNDGSACRNFKIKHLICNQNAQFGTFVSPIRMRSASADIRIDRFEAYNYNGYALVNETGLGNVVDIGVAVLKQQRSNDEYTQGTTAKGFDANNCKVTIGRLESVGLQNASIGRIRGTQAAELNVLSGKASGQVDSTDLIEISNTVIAGFAFARITDFENNTGFGLFNSQDTVEVTYSRVKKPFPIAVENSRDAVKVPFNKAGLYELTLRCNTNPGGNGSYRRVIKAIISIEVFFDGANVVWNAELTELFKSAAGTGFVPALDLQIDLATVGAGTQKTKNNSDEFVFSVPESYNSISYQLEPMLS